MHATRFGPELAIPAEVLAAFCLGFLVVLDSGMPFPVVEGSIVWIV